MFDSITRILMKKAALFLFLLPSLSFGQSITWDSPIEVNANRDFGHTRPKVVIPKDGSPVIMWGKANNLGVYVSKWNGSDFTSPLKVTPNGVNAFVQSWAGPGMEALNDDVFVSFKAQPENAGFVYVVKSSDGGKTFGDTIRVSSNNWSRFPEVAILPNGNPVVTYMDFDPNFKDPRYVVSVSKDGGTSFQKAVNASEKAPGEACDCCPGFIMADSERIIILFRNNDDDLRDIWASISEDGGATFELAKDIDKSNWMIGGCPSTGAEAIIVDDSLVSTWMSGATGNSMINIGTSNLSDLSVGMNAEITPGLTNGIQNYPKIAGDKSLLAVTWQEVANSSRNVNLALSVSGPLGFQKFTPIQVNINDKGVQQSPDIAYDGAYLHLVWQDLTAQKLMYRRGKVDLTASTKPLEKLPYSIYPNPTTSKLSIELSDKNASITDIQLTDISGRPVDVKPMLVHNQLSLHLESLVSGFYFISMKINGHLFTSRVQLVKP